MRRICLGMLLQAGLMAQAAAAQEPVHPTSSMSPARLRAALDSIEAPECPPVTVRDTAGWERVKRPDAGVSWLLPIERALVMERALEPGAQEVWVTRPSRTFMYITGPSESMARFGWPVSVLVDQYQRKGGLPGPRRCYDCTQPIRLCRVADAERRAWIATGRQSGWGSDYVDMLVMEVAPDRWVAISAHSAWREDARRWAVVRSVRVEQ